MSSLPAQTETETGAGASHGLTLILMLLKPLIAMNPPLTLLAPISLAVMLLSLSLSGAIC